MESLSPRAAQCPVRLAPAPPAGSRAAGLCRRGAENGDVTTGNPPTAAAALRATLLTLALPLVAAWAQGVRDDAGDLGTSGRHTIEGRLYLPSGRRLERRLRVRLRSVRGGEYSTTTDDNGTFSFRRLADGTYQVTVEGGKEFETATETVEVIENSTGRAPGNQPGQVFTLQLRLEPKRPDGPATRPGVVAFGLAAVPREARELYERALASARDGERPRAVEELKSALKIHPEFPLALNELGVQYMALGQVGRAADALRSAVALAPVEPALRVNYGIILIRQKKYAEAEAELGRGVALDEASTAARLHHGHALIRLGRDAEAERELLIAIKLGEGRPAVALAYRYLGAIYNERGDDERAAAALEAYLRLAPDAGDAAQIRRILEGLR
jgi:tetratricopeptide (TPR) repeat protein